MIHVHLIVAKNVLRYLKGTIQYGLKYAMDQNINLHGYVDLDWASSAINRKSTSGCCFRLGFGVISWFSRKQSSVALSTFEAEYIATCLTSCEEMWPRMLRYDLFYLQLDVTCIFYDNKSCVKLS